MTSSGPAAPAAPASPPPTPAGVVLLHMGEDVPAWARAVAGAVTMSLPSRADTSGESGSGAALAEALAGAECALLDADMPDPLGAARRVHRAEPEVQVVLVVRTEARRRVLERALAFTPGVGELWLASPDDVGGGITERAAGVTRQRRRFRRTRERIERERVEASPQRRERALISDAYLANLLQVLPDPVFSIDAAGRILSANPAAGRVLGPAGSDLVGAPLGEALGAREGLVAQTLASAAERPSRAAVTFRREDGGAGHGELLVARVAESEPALFAAVLHDLTERHRAQERLEEQTRELEHANQQLQEQAAEVEAQAEELQATVAELAAQTEAAERAREALVESERQFRTLADAIPTLAWTARADGYIDWYNAQWYAYTGTAPADMAGWGWQRVHDPAVLSEVLARWRASIATGDPFEMTFPLRGADGRFRAFLTRVTPVRDAEGRVVRWFGTNTDVEAERAARSAAESARAEAERQREAAEAANRAKSEFLSTMSHELRTPLNAIQGYTELLAMGLRGPVTEAQRQDLERVRRANQHLMGLITDILNFARLEAGQVEFHPADVDVAPLLADVEALVAPQLAAKGLAFGRVERVERVERVGGAPSDDGVDGPDQPYAVRADPEKLRQILLNLLTNAIKFTDAGGRVAVACTRDSAAGVVHIRVVDTGRGIPAEHRARIFEPFVQVDRHRTHESQQGVGLGLAISRDLARGMGGELTLESTSGQGSTFRLTLPGA